MSSDEHTTDIQELLRKAKEKDVAREAGKAYPAQAWDSDAGGIRLAKMAKS